MGVQGLHIFIRTGRVSYLKTINLFIRKTRTRSTLPSDYIFNYTAKQKTIFPPLPFLHQHESWDR